jgi:hypothetical protein
LFDKLLQFSTIGGILQDIMKRNAFLVALFLVLCSSSVIGQQKKFSATVQVQVFSSDKKVSDEFYSLITRELRSLNDVAIVDTEGAYILLVFPENINGKYYAFTFNVGKNAECTYKQTIVNGKPLKTNCIALESFNSMSIFSSERLKEKIEALIIGFDTDFLEPDRKIFNKTNINR